MHAQSCDIKNHPLKLIHIAVAAIKIYKKASIVTRNRVLYGGSAYALERDGLTLSAAGPDSA